MTALSDMTAAGFRVLDLLTVGDAAARLGCSADTVRRLARDGVLEVERFGSLVRITPESVAAYEQRDSPPARPAGARSRVHGWTVRLTNDG